jgi:hypothetical protein
MAINIFQKHFRNQEETITKGKCRDLIAEAYQGLEMFDEASVYIRENQELHANSVKTYILLMRDALHNKRFTEIRKAEIRAEEILDKLNPSVPGDFLGQCFREQIIDVMKATCQVKNIPI